MAVWMVRAGRKGEQEQAALQGNFVTIHWIELPDLSVVEDKKALKTLYEKAIPSETPAQVAAGVGEVWAFCKKIERGDLVVLPLHEQPTLPVKAFSIGRVTGPYCYCTDRGKDIKHIRRVEWIRKHIPRTTFQQDLKKLLGIPLAVYQISRNNAEQQILEVARAEADRRSDNTESSGNKRSEDTPRLLTETLEDVRKRIAKAKQKGENVSEADTQMATINPVLQALGWNLGNLEEVRQQYRGADYALFIQPDSKPTMLVEAKGLQESLGERKHGKQIMGYVGILGAEWVVLTNGDEYRIYNGTSGAMAIEERLFRTVRLTDPDSPAEETLALLSRARIGDLQRIWEDERADRQVRAAIAAIFSPPHPKLVSFVKTEVKGLTPTQIKASVSRICAKIKIP